MALFEMKVSQSYLNPFSPIDPW